MNLPPRHAPDDRSPSDDLRARIMAAVHAEPVSPRAVGQRYRLYRVLRVLIVWALISLAIGLPGIRGRPLAYVVVLAVTWALVGAAATWAGVARGRSMLGRTAAWRTVTALCTPPALLVTALALGAFWPETLTHSGGIARHLLCVLGTVSFALGPLGMFVAMWRASDPVAPRLTGAAIGAAAGSWGALVIELHCQFTSPFHVAFGHVLPVSLLALAGIFVGQRYLAVR